MNKQNKLENVLSFYKKVNLFKTTIDQYNYSKADFIYGTLILAILYDAEFKESNDVGEIIKLILFDEISKQDKRYQIDKIISTTKDKLLISKYRIFEYSLSNLIINNRNLSYEDLLPQAIDILNIRNEEDTSKYETIFKLYYQNFKLKDKIRSGWDYTHWNVKTNRIERVSEHIVSTLYLALVINNEFCPDIDINKVLKMLTIHEQGETQTNDYTPFDGISKEVKIELEHKAIIELLSHSKDKDRLINLILEFDDHISNESIFSFFCDKLEADLQSKIYEEKHMHHSLDDQKFNVVFKSEKIKEMIANGASTAFEIWYLYDKSNFNSNLFPEFIEILDYAKENSILDINNSVQLKMSQ